MRLREAIETWTELPEDATLFVERIDGRFTPESRAVSVVIPEAYNGQPIQEITANLAPGLEYFLEVSIVREILEGWTDNHTGTEPSGDQALESTIFYAENDAYPDSFFG